MRWKRDRGRTGLEGGDSKDQLRAQTIYTVPANTVQQVVHVRQIAISVREGTSLASLARRVCVCVCVCVVGGGGVGGASVFLSASLWCILCLRTRPITSLTQLLYYAHTLSLSAILSIGYRIQHITALRRAALLLYSFSVPQNKLDLSQATMISCASEYRHEYQVIKNHPNTSYLCRSRFLRESFPPHRRGKMPFCAEM